MDVLQVLAWQQQGKKGAPKPKPIKRPGLKPDVKDVQKFGGKAIDQDEMRELLRVKNGR